MIKRNTHQQAAVLEALSDLMGMHPTADAIHEHIRQQLPSISRATVYRILNQLAADNIILRVQSPNAADIYDNNANEHYHIKCVQCGGVFDADFDVSVDFNESKSFKVTGYDIIFYGNCKNCEKNGGM